ncbi:MAG: hypothetical protein ABI395_02375 [Sphingobium sp.]
MRNLTALIAVAALGAVSPPVHAQDTNNGATNTQSTKDSDSASDTVQVLTLPSADEHIDVATIEVPSLTFTPDPLATKDFDKYYYFHRIDTDFKAALADLRDCDGLSRGLSNAYGNMQTPYPYNSTGAGIIGGAIGNAMVAAIFGSAQVRATRRINMRRCMSYKGYQRFGLPKDIWEKFNFEEGFHDLNEGKRQSFLMQQAKIASADMPKTEVLGK